MEPHNENSRVKIPALVHFTRIGYQYVSIKDYTGPIDGDTNIFVDLLRSSINRLNGTELSLENTQKIVDELKLMLDNDDLGRAFYNVLLNGYNGLKLIEFDDVTGVVNSFCVVTCEDSLKVDMYNSRFLRILTQVPFSKALM